MEKYLIEACHAGDKASCMLLQAIYHSSGSHFITHAEWGCIDGDYKAWLVVETRSKEEALQILPSAYRPVAKITKIHRFSRMDLEASKRDHHT